MAGRVQLVGLEPTLVTETIQTDFSGMLTRNPAELDAAPRGTRGYGIWTSAAGG